MQLEGLQQQLLAAGISKSCLSPEHQCLPADAAHSAAIDDAIESLPVSASYIAARNALICKFWASFKCPMNELKRHVVLFELQQGVLQRSGFYVAQGTPIILMDDWVCKELRQTANILQHDMARMGYIVEIRETGRYESIVQPQGTFSWIIITFDDGKQG